MAQDLLEAPKGDFIEAERPATYEAEAFLPEVIQLNGHVVLPEETKSMKSVTGKNLYNDGCITQGYPVQHQVPNGVEAVVASGHATIPDTVEVTLPDMFVSFMALTPKVNRHYEQVRAESEAWIIK